MNTRLVAHGAIRPKIVDPGHWKFEIEGNANFARFTIQERASLDDIELGSQITVARDNISSSYFSGEWTVVLLFSPSHFVARRVDA